MNLKKLLFLSVFMSMFFLNAENSEPESAFIVTRGENDPGLPNVNEMKGDLPVLQIRTTSVSIENSIESIKFIIPDGNYMKFGEDMGISGISLWIDSDNDGKGDIKIAESSFKTVTDFVIFDNLTQPLTYSADEEKYLVVNITFDMTEVCQYENPESGAIKLPEEGVQISDNSANILGIPISSKRYSCGNDDDIDDGVFYPDDKEIGDGDGEMEYGCSCIIIN